MCLNALHFVNRYKTKKPWQTAQGLVGSSSAFEQDLESYIFAKLSRKHLIISKITKSNQPRTIKELLLRLFVVKAVIPKSKVLDLRSIKKSTQAYLLLNEDEE